uniref:Uncharacterized protein n=2 Tax=Oryza TaxID=4527 RepID=A0A0D3HBH9_9ORYZ
MHGAGGIHRRCAVTLSTRRQRWPGCTSARRYYSSPPVWTKNDGWPEVQDHPIMQSGFLRQARCMTNTPWMVANTGQYIRMNG